MTGTTDRTRLDRRLFCLSSAALGASLLWRMPAMAQAEPVLPPYRYEEFTHNVIDLCAAYYGTTREAVLSPLREKPEVMARQSAMFIARRLGQMSLPELGRRTGGRSHTTVLHAVRKIEDLVEVDPLRRYDIAVLTDAAHRVARIRIVQEKSLKAAS